MQTDPKTIKKHFQKSMDKYEENAVVQKITAEKLCTQVLNYKFPTKINILEIGSGTGLLTKMLSESIDYKLYYTNDLVEKSEIYVKKYLPNTKFYAGDFRNIKLQQKFDLIVSNAVFQWFDKQEKIFEKCANLLNNNGILAFSTFSPNNFYEFKSVAGFSLQYKTTQEIKDSLEERFKIVYCDEFREILNFDNPLKILAHMKNTGVNSLSVNQWGIKEVKKFCNDYREQFPDLTLTYSPIIILAKLK